MPQGWQDPDDRPNPESHRFPLTEGDSDPGATPLPEPTSTDPFLTAYPTNMSANPDFFSDPDGTELHSSGSQQGSGSGSGSGSGGGTGTGTGSGGSFVERGPVKVEAGQQVFGK